MSVARASLVMIAALVASRILGWLRLSVIGATFGQTADLDAFMAAFKIPNALFELLVAGALSSAFIPVFAGFLAKEREKEAWHVASSVMNVLVVSLMVLSGLMWIAAPWLVPTIVAPGFAQHPAQLELTIQLTRVMLLSPIFMGLSALVTGVLQSYRQFLAGAVAPLVYNGVQILFALFAAPFLGIHALAVGVVAGAAMMFLAQLPELTFRRTKYELAFDLGHPSVREVFALAGPRTLSLGAVQIVFFVDTYLASSMPTGSLSALNYAFQLMLLPLGVFSIAISAAVFPTLSHYASLGQAAKMRDALQQAIRWILFLTLPTAILMVVLRRPIVNLLFQYGQFGADARELTQAAFLFYALGLAGHALVQILARAYYASRDTTTPVALTLISIGLNVILSVTLAPILGINGLALANSVATLAEAAMLLAMLAPRARLRMVGLGYATLKQLTAALLMGVGMFLFIRVTNIQFDLVIEPPKPVLLLQTLLATAFGGIVYVVAAYLMRIGELQEVLAFVRGRFRRAPVVTEPT
ncbi:MAG TPA: murein biosynthesis integral membrane protein MurJ [Candidatus Limnocylindria bacterium]|nr:murein biosynthesis integral membrane protein MurJ [Candidatus Limnocylindria bacterium]